MENIGIIFDFDGVIVLSEPVHARAWMDIAADLQRELPPGFLQRGIGLSDAKLSEELSIFWDGIRSTGEILENKRKCYQRRCYVETTFVPGILDALEHLAERFPVALATSSSTGDIEPHLGQHGLRKHFKAVLTIESVTHPKPHPEIYLKAAEQLSLPPERCFVFEDSIQGATAARAAGARVIGMTTSLTPEALAPIEAHFRDYADISAILRILTRDLRQSICAAPQSD